MGLYLGDENEAVLVRPTIKRSNDRAKRYA
jgi:hypothetical protein